MIHTAVNTQKKRRHAISKGIANTCSHNIEWYLKGKGLRLWDADIEHIQNMLIENHIEGALCSIDVNDREVPGWWQIQI